ncbi:MAG TPA: DUF4097 family beta strand repeat-containing protein [Steroidobacteraceae bacterium]|nr:DUF4097 family beta strand repeat-containing protein [Steroidobacteraceae bacterium]
MRPSKTILATSLLFAALPLAALANGGPVNRTVPADANGEVEISNVSGTVDVRGWDRNEVQVTGHLGGSVERLDVESSGGHTLVKVVLPRGHSGDGEADIEVHVPKGSTVEVGVVSADISSRGVLGTQRLKTVSGEVTADVSGDDSEIRSVSGDVTVRGTGKPISLRLSSVSGSIDLMNSAGKLDVVTVSGDARVQMGETTEVRGRTTSGDLEVRAKLTSNGRIDVEGVSGEITLRVGAAGGVSTEIESFSGDIVGCLAEDKVERVSKYGPGVRLNLRAVESGGARIRAKTLSGDIDICDR